MKSPAVGLVNFLRDESGAAAAEYGMLLAALVVLVAVAVGTSNWLVSAAFAVAAAATAISLFAALRNGPVQPNRDQEGIR